MQLVQVVLVALLVMQQVNYGIIGSKIYCMKIKILFIAFIISFSTFLLFLVNSETLFGVSTLISAIMSFIVTFVFSIIGFNILLKYRNNKNKS